MRTILPHHFETIVTVPAKVDEVFAHLDDPIRLASHMSKSSWMMGGGRMITTVDQGLGRQVGSVIRLTGRVFGLNLLVDEAVTEHEAPRRKVWETIGEPRLLVVGRYRMGIDLDPQDGQTQLRVFIDYTIPPRGVSRILGWLFGRMYAKWCVQQMALDAVAYFEPRRRDSKTTQINGITEL